MQNIHVTKIELSASKQNKWQFYVFSVTWRMCNEKLYRSTAHAKTQMSYRNFKLN